jgi:hypothetical protein
LLPPGARGVPVEEIILGGVARTKLHAEVYRRPRSDFMIGTVPEFRVSTSTGPAAPKYGDRMGEVWLSLYKHVKMWPYMFGSSVRTDRASKGGRIWC